MAVAYIDARTVADRLDETVGPQNWCDGYIFKRPLAKVCRVVQRCHLADYRAEAAGALALWGRFIKPLLLFCADSLPPQTPDPLRSLSYLQTLDTLRGCPLRLLSQRIAEVIHDFPELRLARTLRGHFASIWSGSGDSQIATQPLPNW